MPLRTIVYTAIIGSYDGLHDPLVVSPYCDYVCFTDQPLASDIWKIVPVTSLAGEDARRTAKRHKIFPHILFPEHTQSLWIDAHQTLLVDPVPLFNQYLAQHDIALFAHPKRDCIYDEATVCKAASLDYADAIDSHMRSYRAEGYPEHAGLAATGFILRRHTDVVSQLMTAWWHEIVRYNSRRDQLSFNAAIYRSGVQYTVIPGDYFQNPYIAFQDHKGLRTVV